MPFPPGGSVDVLGRLIAQRMQENWGQTVIVETRPGAATMIGTASAAKAEPDGYTLIIVVSNHTTNPALQPKMQYDALKDFEPIALLARTPVVLYAHPSLPAKDAKELVALGKAKTHTLNFGSAGTGSMTHLTGEMLKIRGRNRDAAHRLSRRHAGDERPARRAPAVAVRDRRAGAAAVPRRAVARARHLVGERYPIVPEIPTFREQGLDVVATEWYGLLAPAGTPKPIIEKLNAEMKRIMALPNMGDRLAAIELTHSTPQELDGFIRGETERWGTLIKQLGLRAE